MPNLLVFDLEADGFLDTATKVWCWAALVDGEEVSGRDIGELLDLLDSAELLVGHNIIDYDLPLLRRLYGWEPEIRRWGDEEGKRVFDTVVASRLMWPDIPPPKGWVGKSVPHSIEAWAIRLGGERKVPIDDWSTWDPEFLVRCRADARITSHLYQYIQEEIERYPDWAFPLEIETEVAFIIQQQIENGWRLDIPLAKKHLNTLISEADRIEAEIRPVLVPKVEQAGATNSKPFKKNGEYSARTLARFPGGEVGGPYTPVDFVEPSLSSTKDLIHQLMLFGWEPTEFTPTGLPKLGKEQKEELDEKIEHPIGKGLALWTKLKHRQGQMEGWLAKLRPDGKVSAVAVPCGTNTGRMRQHVIVNVPKVNRDKVTGEFQYYPEGKVLFGTEMREVWIPDDGYVQVGYDSKSCQLRILGHYMKDEGYNEAVTTGDPHQRTADLGGIANRDIAKNAIYALIFGAGDAKLAQTAGFKTAREGKKLRAQLLKGMPKLGKLMDDVARASRKGWLRGLDGRKLTIRGEHAALNLLIQGGEAVFMKVLTCILHAKLRALGWTKGDQPIYKKVGDFHDEAQQIIKDDEKYIELFRELTIQSCREANELLGLTCPQEVDISVGRSWKETH